MTGVQSEASCAGHVHHYAEASLSDAPQPWRGRTCALASGLSLLMKALEISACARIYCFTNPTCHTDCLCYPASSSPYHAGAGFVPRYCITRYNDQVVQVADRIDHLLATFGSPVGGYPKPGYRSYLYAASCSKFGCSECCAVQVYDLTWLQYLFVRPRAPVASLPRDLANSTHLLRSNDYQSLQANMSSPPAKESSKWQSELAGKSTWTPLPGGIRI